METSRRAFLSGLLASAFAPSLPRPSITSWSAEYMVFPDIPLEKIGHCYLAGPGYTLAEIVDRIGFDKPPPKGSTVQIDYQGSGDWVWLDDVRVI